MRAIALVAVVLLATGCTLGSQYVRPDPKAPVAWNAARQIAAKDGKRVEVTAQEPAEAWWTAFSDPVLDELIANATQRNLDLKVARARVLEARANRGIVNASLYPQVNL